MRRSLSRVALVVGVVVLGAGAAIMYSKAKRNEGTTSVWMRKGVDVPSSIPADQNAFPLYLHAAGQYKKLEPQLTLSAVSPAVDFAAIEKAANLFVAASKRPYCVPNSSAPSGQISALLSGLYGGARLVEIEAKLHGREGRWKQAFEYLDAGARMSNHAALIRSGVRTSVDIELRMIVGWWYTTRRSANDAEALARAEAWFSSLPAYSKAFEGSSASSVKQSSPLSAIVGKLRREPGTAPAEKDMPTAKTVDPRVAWERQHVYRRMARVCLALLKARKKAGRIPAQLPDLGDTSTDPYTGAPFGFYRQFEGFAIYASSASTQMNTARVQMRSDLSFSEKDTNPPEGYYMR